MARPLRITYPGAFYHITSRGNERKSVFKSRQDRIRFLEYLCTASGRYDAVVHAYCLMDNHYHLLLETPLGNLPQIMHHINGAYTTYFNVKRSRSGHLFQGRYKSILLEKDEYAKELSRYIHLNPVRANMVSAPEKYEWSSYRQYIGIKMPEKWLDRHLILGYFGKNPSVAEKKYKAFVDRMAGKDYKSPLHDVTGSVLLGSQDFIKKIKNEYLQGLNPSSDVPAIRALATKVSIRQISDAAKRTFAEDEKTARKVTIYLSHKHSGEKLKAIGEQFGIGESAVSQICTRFKVMIDQDEGLKKQIRILETNILM